MMTGMTLLLGCAAVLTALGACESIRLRRHLSRIPIRIHVNGTRGKSSVTRLIAAGLREAGLRTVAKTTGTLPRLILPDGVEQPVYRSSRPNVIEQRDVAAVAARLGAEALVVECMALQPQLQWLCEAKFVRATHGVITNCRADHLDVMGPTEVDVARALCNVTPRRGKLFTAEQRHLDVLNYAAKDRRTQVVSISTDDVAGVTDFEMQQFAFDEHKENVALALRVCEDLGVDRATALSGMQQAAPDPGATTTHEIEFFGRHITFVGAFATNDPASTQTVWQRSLDDCPQAKTRIAIVNCRADRPDRSAQLGAAMADWPPADYIVLTGTGTAVFVRAALSAGVDPRRLTFAEQFDAAELFELVVELSGPSAVVVGMGNIGDHGLEIVRYFRNRSRVPELAPDDPSLIMPSNRTPSPHFVVRNGKTNEHVLEHVNGNGSTHLLQPTESHNHFGQAPFGQGHFGKGESDD